MKRIVEENWIKTLDADGREGIPKEDRTLVVQEMLGWLQKELGNGICEWSPPSNAIDVVERTQKRRRRRRWTGNKIRPRFTRPRNTHLSPTSRTSARNERLYIVIPRFTPIDLVSLLFNLLVPDAVICGCEFSSFSSITRTLIITLSR